MFGSNYLEKAGDAYSVAMDNLWEMSPAGIKWSRDHLMRVTMTSSDLEVKVVTLNIFGPNRLLNDTEKTPCSHEHYLFV